MTDPSAGWKQPNFPEGSAAAADSAYDLLEGAQDKAVSDRLSTLFQAHSWPDY